MLNREQPPLAGQFAGMAYRYPFRKHQQLALDAFEKERVAGERHVYLVLPPGTGKTAVGLEIARRLGRRTLVLGPNSAIQAQWLGQWERDFQPAVVPAAAGRELDAPVNVLTYQAVCTLDQPEDPLGNGDGRRRPGAVERRRRAAERRQARNLILRGGDRDELLGLLHANGRALVDRLRSTGPAWTLVFDECHHLLETWGYLMKALVDELLDAHGPEGVCIVGLTATPPSTLTAAQASLHRELFDQVDYEVPTPAVVKEGHLAPYQELVHLTAPLPREARYITAEATRFQELLTDLLDPELASTPFLTWVTLRAVDRRTTEGAQVSWQHFETEEPELARAALRLHTAGLLPLPEGARIREPHRRPPDADDWVRLISDYALNCLAPRAEGDGADPRDAAAWEAIRKALPAVGYVLTRRGVRAGRLPIDRVLARSGGKAAAAVHLLTLESRLLDQRLRALVICDFETSGAELPARLGDVLDRDAGGARLLLELLAGNPDTAALDPVLVTGRTVACTRATARRLAAWAAQQDPALDLTFDGAGGEPGEGADDGDRSNPDSGLHGQPDGDPGARADVPDELEAADELGGLGGVDGLGGVNGLGGVDGLGGDPADRELVRVTPREGSWSPRRYVPLVTRFFEEGRSRCLVGTRALLGEGWDAKTVNVLVDLSAATTPTAVHQMRGRSLRLDPGWPGKVAHNWAVVCVADGHPRGDADYRRLVRKHDAYFALTQGGAIESGVSHIDPELSPFGPPPADRFAAINDRMETRATDRARALERWAVSQPYENVAMTTVRVRRGQVAAAAAITHPANRPARPVPFSRAPRRPRWAWVWRAGAVTTVGVGGLLAAAGAGPELLVGLGAVAGAGGAGALWVQAGRLHRGGDDALPAQTLERLAAAVADGLQAAGATRAGSAALELAADPDGTVRCQLGAPATTEESRVFAEALDELLSPIEAPTWLIPRLVVAPPAGRGQALALATRQALRLPIPCGTVHHAVPARLAANRRTREHFTAAWHRHVSPGSPIRADSPEGAGILAVATGENPFELTTQLRTLWR